MTTPKTTAEMVEFVARKIKKIVAKMFGLITPEQLDTYLREQDREVSKSLCRESECAYDAGYDDGIKDAMRDEHTYGFLRD